MKKLFVDMDGVLADFEKRYRALFGAEPGENRDVKFSERWRYFVDDDNFETLDLFPGSTDLLIYLESLKNVQIAILGSTGGFADHNVIVQQKMKWLRYHDISFPAIFVPGKRYKRNYAEASSILIDDTPDIIDNFKKYGGAAILHKDVKVTIDYVEDWLNDR
jgi:hypothetical protein